jgi:predicted transcriptional regulator of viral defense system
MSYQDLLKIDKPFFSKEEVAHALGISPYSARVLCSRYFKRGLLTRLKRNLYVRTETLMSLGQDDLFRIANFIQVPSYLSLNTALSYYGITSQLQRSVFESISVKRSKSYEQGGFTFRYLKINPELYTGFKKERGAFMASPEKAVLDSFYLASMGRYPLDTSSLDLAKLNEETVAKLSEIYPSRAVKFFERQYDKIRRA